MTADNSDNPNRYYCPFRLRRVAGSRSFRPLTLSFLLTFSMNLSRFGNGFSAVFAFVGISFLS